MNDILISTPWEVHYVDGVPVHVKREDLCCPAPGPPFSKMRGVEAHITRICDELGYDPVIGVVDTSHSMAGWGVAYVCDVMGLDCVDFFASYVHERERGAELHLGNVEIREYQQRAQQFGAELVPMKAGRFAVMHAQSRTLFTSMTDSGYMMPNALKYKDLIPVTAKEVRTTPDELLQGTWIISISSGTVAAGVLNGLIDNHEDMCIILHMGHDRSEAQAQRYIRGLAGYWPSYIDMINEHYNYVDKVDVHCPFPCNPWYDLKAWKWLMANVHDLEQPIIFWNIGS